MKRIEARALLEGSMRTLLDPAKIPLMQAFADGKEIQIDHGQWDDGGDDVSFTCEAKFYRVKPAPASIWAIYRNSGELVRYFEAKDFNLYRESVDNGTFGAKQRRPYTIKEFVEKV